MRTPLSFLTRSIPLLLAVALAPRCSSRDSGGPQGPEDPALATSGTLELTIREVGARPDPDGYTVSIALAAPGNPIVRAVAPGGGAIHLADLPLGVYSLRIDDLAEPCAVTGRHPRTFAITAGATTELELFVSCPGPGAIVVITSTRGRDAGVSGYGLSIRGDSVAEFSIGTSASLRIDEEDLPPGTTWFVELTGVPGHCWVNQPATRVQALQGETVALTFAVACIPPGTLIAYEFVNSIQLFGGSEPVTLGGRFGIGHGPSLSPDRSRVVFSSVDDFLDGSDLYVVGVDGSGGRWLTVGDANAFVGPQAWSPDGSRIVYWKQSEGGSDVYVVNADGSGEIRLTHDERSTSPAWSPDGSSIVFCRWQGDLLEEIPGIYRMSATGGSGITRVVDWGCDPVWSPDGSRIAFTSEVPFETIPDLAVVGADGSGLTPLHPFGMSSAEASRRPTWSPDGTMIAYTVGQPSSRLWLVEFDGGRFGQQIPLFFGTAPSWR